MPSTRAGLPFVVASWLGLVACGGARVAGAVEPTGAGSSGEPSAGSPHDGLAPAGLDVPGVAAPVVDVVAPASSTVLFRAAFVKSDAPPTDAWDATAPTFARAFCIGETCFDLVDLGDRSVPVTTVTAIGSAGACPVSIARARAVRAHLGARGESPPVDQAFVLLELGGCATEPEARLDAVFGAAPVEVLSLRDAPWQPATADIAAALDSREEVNRSLTPDRQRVPITTAEVPECGITLARGLAVYWIRDGVVNQPFDAARLVSAGGSLYAFSYIEGLDPLLERLDRVTCTTD